MFLKSLAKGSDCPPLEKEELRIYSMRFCPYAQRILLLLNHLRIPHTVVNINLRHKPEWFFSKNPSGLVPVLEFGDSKIVCESLIVGEFIDEKFGKNQMLGEDPFLKAQQKMWIERFSKFTTAFYGGLKSMNEQEREESVSKCKETLTLFENFITDFYFGGKNPNFLDLNIWPWFERFFIYEKIVKKVFFDKATFPKLSGWMGRMKQLEAVKTSAINPESALYFIKQYLDPQEANPDFDYGL